MPAYFQGSLPALRATMRCTVRSIRLAPHQRTTTKTTALARPPTEMVLDPIEKSVRPAKWVMSWLYSGFMWGRSGQGAFSRLDLLCRCRTMGYPMVVALHF